MCLQVITGSCYFKKSIKYELKKEIMKTIYVLFAFSFFAFAGFAQDTIQGQVIRVDTVKVEKVKVDTVYVEAQEQPQDKVQETGESPQNSKNKNDKVYYGGYANFSFGKYTVIGIEPLIAYKLLPKLSVGAKVSYEYVKDKRYSTTQETSNYGASIFSRLRVGRKLYGHVEYSGMNYKLYDSEGDSKRRWIPFLYVGGGFSQPITKNTSINAEILWDVLQDDNSPYKTVEPIISVGIGVGF